MFVTENLALEGPHWLINFPSKKHWRQPSKLEWIVEGLKHLRRVIEEKKIASIALPPLGCGNGGLDWNEVRPEIELALGSLETVEVVVFEPTEKYQNVAKPTGVATLTPARALVAEMVRRYWVWVSNAPIWRFRSSAGSWNVRFTRWVSRTRWICGSPPTSTGHTRTAFGIC
jgi:O-acetyl-ADP-ribose deacetylase (regulator of RNase III)